MKVRAHSNAFSSNARDSVHYHSTITNNLRPFDAIYYIRVRHQLKLRDIIIIVISASDRNAVMSGQKPAPASTASLGLES